MENNMEEKKSLVIGEEVYIINENENILDYAIPGKVTDILFDTFYGDSTMYQVDTDEGQFYLLYPHSIEQDFLVKKDEYLNLVEMMKNSNKTR